MIYKLAIINETECIGCTKCIQACPFDAIIGASKQLHTVLKTECTGCGLCVEPCPVDCITLIEIKKPLFDLKRAKQRRRIHRERMQQHGLSDQRMELTKENFAPVPENPSQKKQTIIETIKRIQSKNTNPSQV